MIAMSWFVAVIEFELLDLALGQLTFVLLFGLEAFLEFAVAIVFEELGWRVL